MRKILKVLRGNNTVSEQAMIPLRSGRSLPKHRQVARLLLLLLVMLTRLAQEAQLPLTQTLP